MYQAQATISLNLQDALPVNPVPLRTTFRRTDADPTGAVYDPGRKLVYVAVDGLNEVVVFSAVDAHTVATIPVAQANQVDLTADGTQLIVGTRTSSFSIVDPSSLQVVKKIPLATGAIPVTVGLPMAAQPVTLANGKVLFVVADGLSTGSSLLEWDPSSDTFIDPAPAFIIGKIILVRSFDHSTVLALGGGGLSLYDSAADSFGMVQNISASAVALNPDGSRIAILTGSPTPGAQQVSLLDRQFNTIATYTMNSLSVPTDLIFSRDGSAVYVFASGVVVAFSSKDLTLLGICPGQGYFGVDEPPDIDETGMIFAPALQQRGLAFLDVSTPTALGVDEPVNLSLNPPQGALSSTSPTVLTGVQGLTNGAQVYFGAAPGSSQPTPGTNVTFTSPTTIQVTPPASRSPGAVNVSVMNPDGWLTVVPDGYTYGTQVLAVTPNSGPPSGGTTVTVYGYGMDFNRDQVQVTVGGQPATITQVFPGPGISPFPFPMDFLTFTAPAGNPGSADIVITTPAGSATVPGGFHFIQNVQSFGLPGGSAAQLAYDQPRQRVYASVASSNKVDVFDLKALQFLPAFTAGNSPQGLALTPDGMKLVVTNAADNSASVINPNTGASLATISFENLQGLPFECAPLQPYAVATTSKQQAIIAASCTGVDGGLLIAVDLTTNTIGCGSSVGCAAMVALYHSSFLYIVSSADGSKVFVAEGFGEGAAPLGLWDVTADTFSSRTFYAATFNAISADGSVLAKDFATLGLDLYEMSVVQDVDYLSTGVNNPNYVFGEKLHPSGGLLYAPQVSAVDIFDTHHGHLVRRVWLPVQIPLTLDAMAIDETGARLFLISSGGMTIVTLADLPLSIGLIVPDQAPAAGGTELVIRGSGFQSGATVQFGTIATAANYVDASTLTVITPAAPPGPLRITISNPDGSTYSLDAAFVAQ